MSKSFCKSIKKVFNRACHHRISGWPYVVIMMFFAIFLLQLIMLLILVKIS